MALRQRGTDPDNKTTSPWPSEQVTHIGGHKRPYRGQADSSSPLSRRRRREDDSSITPFLFHQTLTEGCAREELRLACVGRLGVISSTLLIFLFYLIYLGSEFSSRLS